ELRDHRLLRVELLFVDRIGGRQPRVALKVELGVGELRVVLLLLRDGLVVGGLIGCGIDFGENVSLVYVLPFLEQYLDQLAVNLRTYSNGIERLGGADADQIDRDIGCFRGDREHGDRVRPGPAAAGPALQRGLRLLPLRHVIDGGNARDDEGDDKKDGDSPFRRHWTTTAPAPALTGIQPPPSA